MLLSGCTSRGPSLPPPQLILQTKHTPYKSNSEWSCEKVISGVVPCYCLAAPLPDPNTVPLHTNHIPHTGAGKNKNPHISISKHTSIPCNCKLIIFLFHRSTGPIPKMLADPPSLANPLTTQGTYQSSISKSFPKGYTKQRSLDKGCTKSL